MLRGALKVTESGLERFKIKDGKRGRSTAVGSPASSNGDVSGPLLCQFHTPLPLAKQEARCCRAWVEISLSVDLPRRKVLRKEVIQPQIPLRLPCYDLALLTRFTLGRVLLAVGQRTLGTPCLGGLTGGVYKAREHIHRGVADPRLLAIPASRRRIAASDPN